MEKARALGTHTFNTENNILDKLDTLPRMLTKSLCDLAAADSGRQGSLAPPAAFEVGRSIVPLVLLRWSYLPATGPRWLEPQLGYWGQRVGDRVGLFLGGQVAG